MNADSPTRVALSGTNIGISLQYLYDYLYPSGLKSLKIAMKNWIITGIMSLIQFWQNAFLVLTQISIMHKMKR